MKVSNIVSQTKEYERLQGMIENIEEALENMEKTESSSDADGAKFSLVSVSTSGYATFFGGGSSVKAVSVSLNSDVSKLIKSDLLHVLEKYLSQLKELQASLEV